MVADSSDNLSAYEIKYMYFVWDSFMGIGKKGGGTWNGQMSTGYILLVAERPQLISMILT